MPEDAAHERTSLLSNHTIKVQVDSETERDGTRKDDGTVESVGLFHGLSIVLCLWLLIFLQGIWISFIYGTREDPLLTNLQLRMSRF